MVSRLSVVLYILLLSFPSAATAFRVFKENKSRNLGLATSRVGRNLCGSRGLDAERRLNPTALHAAMRFTNFEQVLDTFREEPVIIYFTTAKCGPCQLMKKELAAVKQMIGDEMKMFSVDTEKWPQVGSRFEVARLPCLVVFREGEIKMKLEGVNTAEVVVKQIRSFL
jgi:thioredoxin 1